MEITRGISIFNCNSNEEHDRIVYQLREEDKNIIFFNVGTPFSIRTYDYFKKKKLKTNNCFLAFIYKIFYRFIPDVKTVKELDNYSDGPNRYFMVVKDLISNKNKKYVLGLTALSYGTIDEIVSYLIKNKAEYKMLLINIEYSLKETVYYPNVTVEQALSISKNNLITRGKEIQRQKKRIVELTNELNDILSKGTLVYGTTEKAFSKEETLDILNRCLRLKITVLGGAVVEYKDGYFEHNYDSWNCKKKKREAIIDYTLRSIQTAFKYVSEYKKNDAYFVLNVKDDNFINKYLFFDD